MVSTQQVLALTFIYIKAMLSGLRESAVLSAVLMPAWVAVIFIIRRASASLSFLVSSLR